MKLISMVKFVLEQAKKNSIDSHELALNSYNYANFLNQPLTLGMFVPCDEDGNVLEEPNGFDLWISGIVSDSDEFNKYQQAKEKVLFEGFFDTINYPQYSHYISDGMQSVFYMTKNGSTYKNILGMEKVEYLTNKTPVILTPNAIKQFYL